MRKRRTIGLDVQKLKTFYFSNIRSVISYAEQAWFSSLGEHNSERLEKIQRSCTKIMLPESKYPDRSAILNMTMLSDFLFKLSWSHFNKIRHDESKELNSLMRGTHFLTDSFLIRIERLPVGNVYSDQKNVELRRGHVVFSNFL